MAIRHQFPKPPAGHDWHEANKAARELGAIFQELRSKQGNSAASNEAFSKFYTAQEAADALMAEWKAEYRQKLDILREHLGKAWPEFWYRLPDGDAMAPVVEAKLREIQAQAHQT